MHGVVNEGGPFDPEIYGAGILIACALIENGEQDFAPFVKTIARELDSPPQALWRYYRSWYEGARYACLDNGVDVSGCSTEDEIIDAMVTMDEWADDPNDICSASASQMTAVRSRNATEDELRVLMSTAMNAPTPDAVLAFVDFAQRVKALAPFNMLMVYIQRPGASAVASRREWEALGQTVLPDAIPIVLLHPMGPIRYVFEVSDTVPPRVQSPDTNPLAAKGALDPAHLDNLVAGLRKARERGLFVDVVKADLGENYSGSIVQAGLFAPHHENAPLLGAITECATIERACDQGVHWRIRLNRRLEPAQSYATLVHELGHLFCGHLGRFDQNNPRADEYGWPDRGSLPLAVKEIEAELVAWHMCDRLGLVTGAPLYLRPHLHNAMNSGVLEQLDLDRVIRAIARVWQYGGRQRPR